MIKYRLVILALIPFLTACSSNKDLKREERMDHSKNRIMTEWDLNLDGVVNCTDLELRKINQFKKSDLDENSFLDASEIKAAPWGSKVFSVEMLHSFDQNKDGQVSLMEFSVKPEAAFVALDKNEDCTISEEEIEQSLMQRRSARPKGNGGRGGGKGGRGGQRPN